MKKKSRILLIAELALLSVIVISVLFLSLFVRAGNGVYFRFSSSLDLREKDVQAEVYDELSQKLPKCSIVWNVPFQGGTISSDAKEITLTRLTDADVEVLDYLSALSTVHAEQCRDYSALAALQQRRPGVQVLVNIELGGETFDQDTQSVTLKHVSAEELDALVCFPKLNQVQISGCDDYPRLQELQQTHPEWNLSYTVRLGDQEVAWNSSSVTAENATESQITAAYSALPGLTQLHLVNPRAQSSTLTALESQHPDVELTWEVELYGKKVSPDIKELDLSGIQVKSCEEVEELVACLPNLEKLIMCDCGIDSETMAAYRERQRDNYKVVWRVYLGEICTLRTDDTYFMPIKQGEYYFLDSKSAELKYCEDMVCLDLGHHMIHNADFLAYMPHLKYLILAHGGVRDISPIVNCQELIYLEVDWSEIQDYTPIKELKKLEDLNLTRTACDITPILEMTWLKNLWAPGRGATTRQRLLEALPNTNVVLDLPAPAGQGWRNLPNYYAMRDYLGMYYMR